MEHHLNLGFGALK